VRAMQTARRQTIIGIAGPPGAGKRILAAQVAAALGKDLIAADAGLLTSGDGSAFRETIIRVARLARLKGAAVYWHSAEGIDPKQWKATNGYADLMMLDGASPVTQSGSNAACMVVRL